MHSPKGANFDSRFSLRKAATNAKEKACDGFFVPSLEEVSSATEFRPLRVGGAKLDYMNPRITASPRRPQGGGAMP
jgi:hypothetical protein